MGCEIDFDAKTIEFFVNDVSQGVAFTDLTEGALCFAFSSTCKHVVTLMPTVLNEGASPQGGVAVHNSVWLGRNRTAHLSDASVDWYTKHYQDTGMTALPGLAAGGLNVAELDLYINQFLWMVLRCCHR